MNQSGLEYGAGQGAHELRLNQVQRLLGYGDAVGFAIFSDIHSNHTALSAVHDDLKTFESAYGIQFSRFILGDVLDTGPLPIETLELASSMSNVHIRGNHEDYLYEHVTGQNRTRYASRLWRYVPWTIERIGEKEFREYYSSLKFDWISSDRYLYLMHASTDRNDAVPSFIDWKFASSSDDLVYFGSFSQLRVVGHSHLFGIYQKPGGVIWINAGSVGYPFIAKQESERHVPYSTYVFGVYSPSKSEIFCRLRRVSYDFSTIVQDYARVGVLESCAPYSRGVFLQTILNKSIIFQALQWAKKMGFKPDQYIEGLTQYLVESGNEALIQELIAK